MAEKKKSGGRPKQNYTLEEAAVFLGWKEVDLLRNFYRGLEPGKSSEKNAQGVRVWKLADLKKAKTAEDAPGGSGFTPDEPDTATP